MGMQYGTTNIEMCKAGEGTIVQDIAGSRAMFAGKHVQAIHKDLTTRVEPFDRAQSRE